MTSSGLDGVRLAVLVHEVRSPVAALSALAETAGDSPWDVATGRELVRLGVAACRAIERLVLDAAVASVRVEAVDVGELVHDVVAAHAVRGADVVADAGDGGLVVEGDPVRLHQVLDNLLANALAYAGATRVTVRAARSEKAVRVTVSDAGPGIGESDIDRIFELGVRLDSTTRGSGLGLALARTIVEAHGGELTVDSALGVGSTFTISLPASTAQPEARGSSS
jgi:signal transduction histidine kinase